MIVGHTAHFSLCEYQIPTAESEKEQGENWLTALTQRSYFDRLSGGDRVACLPMCFDHLMSTDKNERIPILHQAHDQIIRYFYSRVSFVDENNLRGVSFADAEKMLSQMQKEMLLRLVILNHPETVKEIQKSDLLSYLVCRELERYPQLLDPRSTEHAIYQVLKHVNALDEGIAQADLLRILIFIRAKRHLAVSIQAESGMGVRKVKKVQSRLPLTFEYNQKEGGDIVVKVGDLDKGMYKTAFL